MGGPNPSLGRVGVGAKSFPRRGGGGGCLIRVAFRAVQGGAYKREGCQSEEHARDHEESPAFSTRAGKEEEEEEEETWEHRPLRLINALNESDEQELPINDTKGIDVKTSVFVGKILVRCRDVPSREGDKEGNEMTEKYFRQ